METTHSAPRPQRVIYSDRYQIDIGPHIYPTAKYSLVRQALEASGGYEFFEPAPASWDDLALVHTAEYLEKVRTGTLSFEEIAQLEIPWSPEIVEAFRLMTGGTIVAAREARRAGVGVHLGGGFHHAFANHGEGFCLFNDVAVAIRVLQRDGAAPRAAVIDCDVHHGNGTAMIFDLDPRVYTCSMHQQHNYPVFKPRSTLDIGLRDGTGDDEYLDKLSGALAEVFAWGPDIVFYLAGADPYEQDQLGGLALTLAGLRSRDARVFAASADAGVPVVVTLAGGYARRLADTVAIHHATIEEAVAVRRRG
jgi:acetoin utilization deacetylase AcuC-like enzyme